MQKCVVHQIRNSLSKVSYKHKKSLPRIWKSIYQAINQESAMQNLDEFAENEVKNILQLSSLGMQTSLN
ncbi:transposase [Mesomycoplasma ovipneumoniae]|nr:transposase [Mesomycoplasma ovipneumoniae]